MLDPHSGGRHLSVMSQRLILSLFASLAFAGVVLAEVNLPEPRQAPEVDELIYGIYCSEEPLRQDPAPGTASGVINIVPGVPEMRFVQQVVPADRAVGFGVLVRLAPGLAYDPVEVTVTHPPFLDATTEFIVDGIQIERWSTSLDDQGYSLIGFTFDHPEEEVPGEWTFSAEQNGEEVFHVAFQVVPGNALPHIPLACAGGALS